MPYIVPMNNTDKSSPPSGPSRAEDRAIYDVPADDRLRAELTTIAASVSVLEDWKRKRPDLWPVILKKTKIRWTADSNAIEGSSLTFADTLFFLEQGLTVEGRPLKDFLDARNHTEAIELVFDAVAGRRPVSEGFIKELNALLLSGVRTTPARDQFGNIFEKPATPGEYKRLPNHVILPDGSLHTYADPLQVPGEVQRLCAFVESRNDLPAVVVAALAHFNFVRIHPFDDGNGRGARILMNLVLMRGHLPPAVIRNEERARYLASLREADAGDIRPFVAFIALSARETIEAMVADFGKTAESGR